MTQTMRMGAFGEGASACQFILVVVFVLLNVGFPQKGHLLAYGVLWILSVPRGPKAWSTGWQ